MTGEGRSKGVTGDQPPQYPQHYGTFQGVANFNPPLVIGFPQPTPPSGAAGHPYGYQSSAASDSPNVNVNIHWTLAGHGVAEGRPVREHRLPCCGIGIGWILFVMGFFFAAIPWYLGALIMLFVRVDYREKPGYVACTIAAILAVIATTLSVTKATSAW